MPKRLKEAGIKYNTGGSFDEAFANARKNKQWEFEWKGKTYHTRTKEEEKRRNEILNVEKEADRLVKNTKKKARRGGAVPYEYNGHVVPGMFKAQDGYDFDPTTIGKVPRERMKSQMLSMGKGGGLRKLVDGGRSKLPSNAGKLARNRRRK